MSGSGGARHAPMATIRFPISSIVPPATRGSDALRMQAGSQAASSIRRRGRGVLYVAPGCFAHPKSRAFWLGGGSEGRRAQGQ